MRDAIDILMENLSQSIVGQTESIRIVLVALSRQNPVSQILSAFN